MKHDPEIVIIGAGIGGLAVGALLAHRGRTVLVLERNPFLGGRCTGYKKQGFTIDTFVHMFGRCEKGPFGQLLARLGRPDALRWWHASAEQRPLMFIDDRPYPYPDASFSTRQDLISVYQGFGLGDEAIRTALRIQETILEMPYEETFALDDVPYSRWLRQFTTDPTILALEHQKTLILCVTTLKETSTGEFIRVTQQCQRDAHVGYPKGGCLKIPTVLADLIALHGGEVRTSSPVAGIMVDRGKVAGVRTAGGETISAPIVVSNAGVKETALRLVGEEHLPRDYVERVRTLTTGRLVEQTPMGMIYLKLALDEPVIEAPLILRNVKEGAFEGSMELMQALAEDKPPASYKGINSFIPVPSVMDPELAPHGRQLVNFYGLAPLRSKDWQPWIDYHLGYLFSLYPQVERHLMWYDFSTLGLVNRFSNRFFPDIVGIAQSVGQTGRSRPDPATPIEGLYLVGSDVGRDNIGTELAAESALRVADMIA